MTPEAFIPEMFIGAPYAQPIIPPKKDSAAIFAAVLIS